MHKIIRLHNIFSNLLTLLEARITAPGIWKTQVLHRAPKKQKIQKTKLKGAVQNGSNTPSSHGLVLQSMLIGKRLGDEPRKCFSGRGCRYFQADRKSDLEWQFEVDGAARLLISVFWPTSSTAGLNEKTGQ